MHKKGNYRNLIWRTPSPPVAYNPLMQRDSWKIKPFRASGVPIMCPQEVSVKLYKRPDGRSANMVCPSHYSLHVAVGFQMRPIHSVDQV